MKLERRELMDLIEKIWKLYPELRLCQLIGKCFADDPYYKDDEDLMQAIKDTYLGE